MERNSCVVRVPGTTANLGPGYDVIGMALNVWLEVRVERAEKFSYTFEGQGKEHIKCDESNMIVRGVKIAFDLAEKPLPPCKYTVKNGIPFGCGCGSSSAAIVAGVMAGLVLSGHTLRATSAEALLQITAKEEGHPDNVAPAIYGGAQIGIHDGTRYISQRCPTPSNIAAVLFVPSKMMKANTHATRTLIPKEVSMADAVHNMSRTALLVLALATNQPKILKNAMDDRFHQPQRAKKLFPHMTPCINAALNTGAFYAYLSGAGPSTCAFVQGKSTDSLVLHDSEKQYEKVGYAMVTAAKTAGIDGSALILTPTQIGAHVVSCDPPMSNMRVKYPSVYHISSHL